MNTPLTEYTSNIPKNLITNAEKIKWFLAQANILSPKIEDAEKAVTKIFNKCMSELPRL